MTEGFFTGLHSSHHSHPRIASRIIFLHSHIPACAVAVVVNTLELLYLRPQERFSILRSSSIVVELPIMLSRHQPMRRTAVVVMMQVLWSCLVYALVRQDAAHAFVFQTTYYSARPPASGSPPFAFTVQGCTRRSICCFAKSINKQAELRRKMEQAKRQKTKQQQQEDNDISTSSSQKTKESLTDREIKEQNDRLRFEELLKRESANVLNDYSSDGYLTRQQEEEEIVAASTYRTHHTFLACCRSRCFS